MPEPTRVLTRPLIIAGIVGLLALLGAGVIVVLAKTAPSEQAEHDAAGVDVGRRPAGIPEETAAPGDEYDQAVKRMLAEQDRHTDELPGGADRRAGETTERSDPLSEEQRQQFLEQSGQLMDRYAQTAAQMQDDYERDVARLQAESELASERFEVAEERGEGDEAR